MRFCCLLARHFCSFASLLRENAGLLGRAAQVFELLSHLLRDGAEAFCGPSIAFGRAARQLVLSSLELGLGTRFFGRPAPAVGFFAPLFGQLTPLFGEPRIAVGVGRFHEPQCTRACSADRQAVAARRASPIRPALPWGGV